MINLKVLDRFSFWKKASMRQKRIYSIVIILAFAIVLNFAFSYWPLTPQEANTMEQEIESLVINKDFTSLTVDVFVNNFILCLGMFIPGFGLIYGMGILCNTGVYIGARAIALNVPTWIWHVSLLMNPIFWLEFVAYSIAMAESIWLIRRLIQGRWSELKTTGILIGTCAVLLIIGALIEAWMILYLA